MTVAQLLLNRGANVNFTPKVSSPQLRSDVVQHIYLAVVLVIFLNFHTMIINVFPAPAPLEWHHAPTYSLQEGQRDDGQTTAGQRRTDRCQN